MPLAWGRDGSALRGHPSRMQVAERTISYRRYMVAGRHIVDTWILAQLYDVAARDLESYGLKDVARHFGVAAPDRTYLPPEDIPRIFREDPARLMAYARDDVLETLGLSAVLSPPYFVQAQAVPFDYQMAVLRGNATKIDALLMREYLHRRQAIPAPQQARAVAGGYTAVLPAGRGPRCLARGRDVALPVADAEPADLSRLRPPGGLGFAAPRSREFRVAAKRLAREATAEADRVLLNALQQTFKILINSFYGYLGFSQGHWNDFDAANRVTGEGRRLVQALRRPARRAGRHRGRGGHRRPLLRSAGSASTEEEHLLARARKRASRGHPARARRPLPGDVQLQDEELRAARRARQAPDQGLGAPLARHRALPAPVDGGDVPPPATGRREEIPALVRRWEEDFQAHRVAGQAVHEDRDAPGVARGLRGEDSRRAGATRARPTSWRSGPRGRTRPGDQVSYYVAGDGKRVKVNEAAKLATEWDPAAPDENTAYYLAKLRELYEKFRPLIEQDGLAPVVEAEEPSRGRPSPISST